MAACTIMFVTLNAQVGAKKEISFNKDIYSCPMHPQIRSSKSGKCSKCGMELKVNNKTFSCPNHTKIVSTTEGKCSICGAILKLNLSEKEKGKYESMRLFSCPMHPNQKSDKAGKCPVCGMEMTK